MANTSRSSGGMQDKAESAASAASQMAGEAKDKAREFVSEAKDKAREFVSTAKDKASEMVSGATQKAQDVSQKAQETVSGMAQKAQDAAANAGQKTDEALTAVGERMTSLAGTIREKAPHEGTLGTAASTVADRLQAGGQYLQDHGLEDMAEDMAGMVRRYPLQSVLVGLGIGFLLGQTFSSRR